MIELIKNYKYDNRYEYVKTFSTRIEQNTYFNTLSSIVIDTNEYVRDNEVFDIEKEYDYLLNEGVNYVIFNNGYRDIYAFITTKEYISQNITRITFEVDVFQTYMFNFSVGKSFVERKVCSLGEICDYDEGIEIGHHIIESDTKVIDKSYTLFAMFNGFKDFYVNKDKTDFKEFPLSDLKRKGTTIDGVQYPISLFALDNEYDIETFYSYLLDHPSLTGIIAIPNCSYTKDNFYIPMVKLEGDNIIKTGIGVQNLVTNITSVNVSGSGVSVPMGTITDMFPYTYYIITDGEVEPLIIEPQYTNGSISVNGKFALSHTPVERYYPTYYKGSTNGSIYNLTNNAVMMLPVGTNAGIETLTANANQFEQNKKSMYANILTGAFVATMGIASGGVGLAVGTMTGVSTLTSSYTTIKDNIARNKDLELTPSSIRSYGTPSTRKAFNTNSVRVVKYTIEDKYKTRLNNYIDRYGNKFNNYATINLKSYVGYIKFNGADVDGAIDSIYINKIIDVLERGVYIE